MITKENLTIAAQNGQGLDHLTDIQVYAAVALDMPLENLREPLSPEVEGKLQELADQLRNQFFERMFKGDALAMIQQAYDPQQPPYLALPIRQVVDKSMKECCPEIEVTGVDSDGHPLVSLSSMARWLDMSEDEVWQFAVQNNLSHIFKKGTCNTVH